MKFNRYWICDKSGLGHGKWQYFEGDFDGDIYYAKSHILETMETWAQWADSFSMEIELDVEPTNEFLEQILKDYQELSGHYAVMTAQVREILKERTLH